MGLFEDELQRSAQRRAQLNAQARAKAQQDAGAGLTGTLANIAKETASPSKKSFLENIFGGIAEGIGDAVATAGNIAKTAVGLMGDATHKEDTKRTMQDLSAKRDEIAKKYGYANYLEAQEDDNASQDFWNEVKGATKGTQEKLKKSSADFDKSIQDVQNIDLNKAKGQAINTFGNMLDVVPGLGVAGNVASGALGGVADAYKANEGGIDADVWNDKTTLARIGAGAGSALAGGAVASKLGAGKTVLGQAGKSALSGAASGATSGAIMSGAAGGNVLSGALAGAGTGALAGGAMGGASALAGNAKSAIGNMRDNAKNSANIDTVADNMDASDAKALGWGNNDMTGSAKIRNKLQKAGDLLQDVGQDTRDAGVIGKLKGNLAEEVTRKDSIQRLREIGFKPDDYRQASALSTVANKAYTDAVNASKATADLPSVYDLAKDIGSELNMTDKQLAELTNDVASRLDAVRVQGGGVSTFDAKGLEDVANQLGKKSKKLTTTSEGGSKADRGTLSPDDAKYAQALDEIKKALRGEVNDMVIDPNGAGDIRAKLRDAGATDKQIEYLTQDGTLSGLKARTSLLEDARNMNQQMNSSVHKRGANSDNSANLMTHVANASGVSGLLDIVASPVRGIVGGVERTAGKVIGGLGDLAAGRTGNSNGRVKGAIGDAINNAKTVAGNLNNLDANVSKGGTDLAKYLAGQANDLGGNFYRFLDKAAPTLRAGSINNLQNVVNRQVAGGIADNAVSDLRDQEYGEQANQAISDAVNQYGAGVLNYIGADATNGLSNDRLTQLQSIAGQYPAETDASAMPVGAITAEQNNPMSEQMAQIGNQMTQISQAMSSAMAAGDFTAYGQLADLYSQAYKMYDALNATSAESDASNELTTSQQTQLTNLNNSLTSLDQLEQAYADAGGAQGLAGNLSEFANRVTGGAVNRGLANYNNMRQSIGAAIIKNFVNLGATEADMKAYMAMLPTAADTAEQAQYKFAKLREMLNQAKANVTMAQ